MLHRLSFFLLSSVMYNARTQIYPSQLYHQTNNNIKINCNTKNHLNISVHGKTQVQTRETKAGKGVKPPIWETNNARLRPYTMCWILLLMQHILATLLMIGIYSTERQRKTAYSQAWSSVVLGCCSAYQRGAKRLLPASSDFWVLYLPNGTIDEEPPEIIVVSNTSDGLANYRLNSPFLNT